MTHNLKGWIVLGEGGPRPADIADPGLDGETLGEQLVDDPLASAPRRAGDEDSPRRARIGLGLPRRLLLCNLSALLHHLPQRHRQRQRDGDRS